MPSVIQRAFSGGEIAPALGARADTARYLTGLKTCRNFFVRREGGVTKRPGFAHIAGVKDDDVSPRLIPFIFNNADQNYVLECGDLYFRFYWHGGQVLSGGNPYEVTTPYVAADVPYLQFAQSADTIVITHPNYAQRELKRSSSTSWALSTISFAPTLAAPTGLSATAGTAGTRTLKYAVTKAAVETYEESLKATYSLASTTLGTFDAPNVLTWDADADAAEYYVYCDPYGNGYYGLIGVAPSNSFNDVGFQPDFSVAPPTAQTLFAATGDYPRAVTYFQQRLVFAGSDNDREKVWGSQIGAYHNFNISTPLKDDDAITFVLASLHLNPVSHVLPTKAGLLVLTDEGEWVCEGDETGALIPTAIDAKQVGYSGATYHVRPAAVDDDVLYVPARGQAGLRSFHPSASYALSASGITSSPHSTDLSSVARHLFDGYSLVDLAFTGEPYRLAWAVRSDGTLLALTYLPEESILAWSRHDTGASGLFEHVCVIPSHDTGGEDELWAVVKRTIDGATARSIERLTPRYVSALKDGIFLDAALTYDGTAATTISGLDHLEGEVVAVLADGVVIYDGDPDGDDAATYTVSGGEITLPAAASVVQVGLRYLADLETLDLDVQGSSIRDKRKLVKNLTVLVESSPHGFLAGPDSDNLTREVAESWETAATPVTQPMEVTIAATWNTPGRLFLRHSDPVPFAVNAVVPIVEMGG